MGRVARALRHQGNLPADVAMALDSQYVNTARFVMDDAQDVSGTTTQAIGGQWENFAGERLAVQDTLELTLYSEIDRINIAEIGAPSEGNFGSASEGTILQQSPSGAVVLIKPDSTGRFSCTINITTSLPGTLVVVPSGVNGSLQPMGAGDFDSVTFDP